jgi:integrase
MTEQSTDGPKVSIPIKWYGEKTKIYSRTWERRKGETIETFYGRVWIPSEKKFRYFKLGTAPGDPNRKEPPKSIEQRFRTILGDPEKALERRKKVKPVPGPKTLDKLVEEFLKKYQSRGGSTYYKDVSPSWIAFFGKATTIDKITRRRVEDFRDHLRRKEYGDSTVRKYIRALGTMFTWAVGRGYVAVNPASRIQLPPEPNRNVVYLTDEQEKALLEKLKVWARPSVAWAIGSGMRLGEILNLRWEDIDRAQGLIKIDKSKTGRARAIPLNAPLLAILEGIPRLIRVNQETGKQEAEPKVFLGAEKRPMDRWRLCGEVDSAFERAELPKPDRALFNLFRHTYGTRLAKMGIPMIKIAQLMGNSPRVVERHYAGFSPDSELRLVMERLGARVAGSVAGDSEEKMAGSGNAPK